MTPFVQATGCDREREQRTRAEMIEDFRRNPGKYASLFDGGKIPTEEVFAVALDWIFQRNGECLVFVNDLYQVSIWEADVGEDWPPMLHLSIRRRDREPVRDWRHFQQIKNELVGPEHEGVELYPAESRCVDVANQYHLFVLKNPRHWFPFGFPGRFVDDASLSTTKQRPREKASS